MKRIPYLPSEWFCIDDDRIYLIHENPLIGVYSISIELFLLIYQRLILRDLTVTIPGIFYITCMFSLKIKHTEDNITIGCTTFTLNDIINVYKAITNESSI